MKKQRLWATLHPFFEGGGVMGRSVANEGFIRAFIRAAPYDGCHFFLADEGAVRFVTDRLATLFPEASAAGFFQATTRHALPDAVARNEYAVFHLSDCVADTVPLLRLRNALARNIFAVTGVTHSLSYARYPLYFFDQLWRGVTDKDAIIATSTAGLGVMEAMFAFLRKGYGLDETVRAPRLARIPLGVSPEDFIPPEGKAAACAALRGELGIPADHLVFLVFARISHYSKMDILPLFRALLRAEGLGLARGGYTLVLSGWMDGGDEAAKACTDIAARLGIAFRLVPSPDNALRRRLFAAADVFLSPVDNPQETFGLTMLEAGLAALPVVASDFDGYRDLVEHGETGFLAPTLGPGSTRETDALSGVWFDNQQHLALAQQTVVSVPETAKAIAALAADGALRARFGERARRRVLENYTWDHVLRAYFALWDELAAAPAARPEAAHPLHPPYGVLFGGYYTRLLDEETASSLWVRWTAFGEAVYRGKDFPAIYAGVERLVSLEDLRRLLFRARKPARVADLLGVTNGSSGEDGPTARERAAFLLLWALKHDLLEHFTPEMLCKDLPNPCREMGVGEVCPPLNDRLKRYLL
ncbi:MAG: glycosyltransferase family 4 protein [Deltaproteobacteria bacterium]|jgi:glycosyltransferase involved in cell wall biosynthesis|nr:glycosyltransferase family 4 protein [Deltaproteobacteria bacterium]